MLVEDLTDGTEELGQATADYVRDNPDTMEARILTMVAHNMLPETFTTGILLWACAAIMQERTGIPANAIERARKTFAANWFAGDLE